MSIVHPHIEQINIGDNGARDGQAGGGEERRVGTAAGGCQRVDESKLMPELKETLESNRQLIYATHT